MKIFNFIDLNIILIFLIFLIIYPFLIYPILLKIFRLFINNYPHSDQYKDELPEVTLISSFFNEEDNVEGFFSSIFNLNYPSEKLKIIIGSDGSTDNTNKLLLEIKSHFPNIDLHFFERSGKNAIIDNLNKLVVTDYVFYIDADIRLQPNTLKEQILLLSNEDIACVLSFMKYKTMEIETTNSEGEGWYQRYENYLRYSESVIKSNVSALGAFFGIKKEIITLINDPKVCDDYIPILEAISRNKRVIFNPKAIVYEVRNKESVDESNRRIRVSAGGLATLLRYRDLLKPRLDFDFFFLFSHKVIRFLLPINILLLFLTSFIANLLENKFAFIILIFYTIYFIVLSIALISKSQNKFLKFLLYFYQMNYGLFLGFIRFIKNENNSIWKPGSL